jgi:hypothetical protein
MRKNQFQAGEKRLLNICLFKYENFQTKKRKERKRNLKSETRNRQRSKETKHRYSILL